MKEKLARTWKELVRAYKETVEYVPHGVTGGHTRRSPELYLEDLKYGPRKHIHDCRDREGTLRTPRRKADGTYQVPPAHSIKKKGHYKMSIIGYGVDTKDLNRYDIFSFFMKHDSKERVGDMTLDILSKRKDKDELTRTEIDRIADNICEWIRDHDGTVADYIAGIINREEKAAGHIHKQNVVTVYDSYIVFNAILSPEDRKKRLERIRTKEDFASLIKGYLPYGGLVFGTVYDGYKTILTCWIEPDKP